MLYILIWWKIQYDNGISCNGPLLCVGRRTLDFKKTKVCINGDWKKNHFYSLPENCKGGWFVSQKQFVCFSILFKICHLSKNVFGQIFIQASFIVSLTDKKQLIFFASQMELEEGLSCLFSLPGRDKNYQSYWFFWKTGFSVNFLDLYVFQPFLIIRYETVVNFVHWLFSSVSSSHCCHLEPVLTKWVLHLLSFSSVVFTHLRIISVSYFLQCIFYTSQHDFHLIFSPV